MMIALTTVSRLILADASGISLKHKSRERREKGGERQGPAEESKTQGWFQEFESAN